MKIKLWEHVDTKGRNDHSQHGLAKPKARLTDLLQHLTDGGWFGCSPCTLGPLPPTNIRPPALWILSLSSPEKLTLLKKSALFTGCKLVAWDNHYWGSPEIMCLAHSTAFNWCILISSNNNLKASIEKALHNPHSSLVPMWTYGIPNYRIFKHAEYLHSVLQAPGY